MASSEIPARWLARARRICLALPEAAEQETWGHPTFRVRSKIFAGIGTGPGDADFAPVEVSGGRSTLTTMTMKAPPGEQEALLAVGAPFFRPRYVGSKGWIGVVIDTSTDWEEIAELVTDSYRLIAPRSLVRLLDGHGRTTR